MKPANLSPSQETQDRCFPFNRWDGEGSESRLTLRHYREAAQSLSRRRR